MSLEDQLGQESSVGQGGSNVSGHIVNRNANVGTGIVSNDEDDDVEIIESQNTVATNGVLRNDRLESQPLAVSTSAAVADTSRAGGDNVRREQQIAQEDDYKTLYEQKAAELNRVYANAQLLLSNKNNVALLAAIRQNQVNNAVELPILTAETRSKTKAAEAEVQQEEVKTTKKSSGKKSTIQEKKDESGKEKKEVTFGPLQSPAEASKIKVAKKASKGSKRGGGGPPDDDDSGDDSSDSDKSSSDDEDESDNENNDGDNNKNFGYNKQNMVFPENKIGKHKRHQVQYGNK